MDEPMLAQSKTEYSPPVETLFQMERALPSRMMERTETLEPQPTKSKTLADDPKRTKP
jgi:hypothetical protein